MKRRSILLTGMMLAAGIATAQTNNEGSMLPSYETEISQLNESGGHRGLDFSIRPGFQFFTGDNSSTSFTADLELGKRFSKHFYWGVGAGAIVPLGGGSMMIPVTTDVKVYFPLKTKTFTPGILLRSGYVINTDDGYDIKTGKHSYEHIDASNFVMLQAMPTLDIALNSRTDFSIGVGYTHYMASTSGGKGTGAFTIQGAFNFHKSTDGKRKRKPKVPTRNRGVELTLEGGIGVMKGAASIVNDKNGALPNPGGNFIASYKFNPHLNVGVGVGYSTTTNEAETGGDGIYTRYGDDEHHFEHGVELGTVSTTRLFLRGEYAFSTKKFTPFVSCDLGLNMYSYNPTEDSYGYTHTKDRWDSDNSYGEEVGKALFDKVKKSGLFVSPAIGASLRLTNNSYLKFRIGYQLTSGGCKHELENELKGKYKKAEIKCIQYSQPYINIGFTHTFSWGENWFK